MELRRRLLKATQMLPWVNLILRVKLKCLDCHQKPAISGLFFRRILRLTSLHWFKYEEHHLETSNNWETYENLAMQCPSMQFCPTQQHAQQPGCRCSSIPICGQGWTEFLTTAERRKIIIRSSSSSLSRDRRVASGSPPLLLPPPHLISPSSSS